MKGEDVIKKHKAVISTALNTEAGQKMLDLLKETFVDVNLMGSDDRETVANVAQHDLVVYLMDMSRIDV